MCSFLVPTPVATNTIVGDDTDGLSEEDASVEVISPPRHASPPRRPITRSVSAKRAADEMEPEDVDTLLASPLPHPRKIRRLAGVPSMSVDYF